MATEMLRKGPLTIDQAKKVLRSKEMQKKLDKIKQQVKDAGEEPESDSSIVLGPKDERANKRHAKQLERDMEESMDDEENL